MATARTGQADYVHFVLDVSYFSEGGLAGGDFEGGAFPVVTWSGTEHLRAEGDYARPDRMRAITKTTLRASETERIRVGQAEWRRDKTAPRWIRVAVSTASFQDLGLFRLWEPLLEAFSTLEDDGLDQADLGRTRVLRYEVDLGGLVASGADPWQDLAGDFVNAHVAVWIGESDARIHRIRMVALMANRPSGQNEFVIDFRLTEFNSSSDIQPPA